MLESRRVVPRARSVSPISVFAGGAAHRKLCLLATPVGFILQHFHSFALHTHTGAVA